MPVREKLDPTPVAMPVGFKRPESLQSMVQRYVRSQLSAHAAEQGYETFEEADDFDVGDEPELRSPYEVDEGLPRWREDEQKKSALRAFEEELEKRERALEEREEKVYRRERRRAVKKESGHGREGIESGDQKARS